MRKVLKNVLTLLVALLLLVSCSSSPKSDQGSEKPKDGETTVETPKEPTDSTCKVKIGLVTDTGGVDDKSFNQSAWEGLQRYAKENNVDESCVKYLQSNADSDYIPNLTALAEEGYNLVIAVGYLFQQSVDTVAPQFPDTNFLFIDSVSEVKNVQSAVYAAEHGSYLVGIAAGLKAIENGSKKVGFIGGQEGDLIGAFQAGFEQGVLSVCPDCTIMVDYADSFSDDAKGQNLAAKQYNSGATVIFQAAGAAGNGVIKEAKERGDVWAIGVDKDQYQDGMKADNTSIILTSMLKRVDISTFTAAGEILNDTFKPGVKTFDLTNDGVGAEISTGRNLTDDVIAKIQAAAEDIKAGKIVVDSKPQIANGASNK